MLPHELKELENINKETPPPTVSVEELKALGITNNTTLLYGYDINRNTRHVYFMDGLIHVVVYNLQKEVFDIIKAPEIECRNIIPNKRIYPESSLFAFIKLIKEKGVHVSITTFNDKVPETEMISSSNQKIIKPIYVDGKIVDAPETYNCAFTFAFEVANCPDPHKQDANPDIIRKTIIEKINNISDEELLTNIGHPFDSYQEE